VYQRSYAFMVGDFGIGTGIEMLIYWRVTSLIWSFFAGTSGYSPGH
jgi:hypothetical protein